MELAQFRVEVTQRMAHENERPFVCDGSPLDAWAFIVGFNPATTLKEPFWSSWHDQTGFDRARFDAGYREVRKRKSVVLTPGEDDKVRAALRPKNETGYPCP
jgi:hypothetical protein